MKSILFIANNCVKNQGLSGGDRIFTELLRHWQSKINLFVMGSDETKQFLYLHKLKQIPFLLTTKKTLDTNLYSSISLIYHYVFRVFTAIFYILSHHSNIFKFNYVYSVSDFYPDFLPALFIKLIHPKTKWIAGFYLFAPNPFSPQSPYTINHRFFRGLMYYISQRPVYFLVKTFADIIFITSTPDKKFFPGKKVVIIRGGVDISPAKNYLQSISQTSFSNKKFDAVYLGRLHFQKGIMELVDIWNLVLKKLPQAKLAIIGDGNLEHDLKTKISQLGVQNNIKLFGFLDGQPKYQIFKNSKIIVHPAIYDSGGMAAAEAMAWGLPGVSFNLESLKSYYPQGMLKAKCFNIQDFADKIYLLLTNKTLYRKQSSLALNLIHRQWSWEKRASEIYDQVFKI
ncbi:MAG: glycosyltransferase [Candidatus Shapirobacteria bacterium]|nr:glycosyltransferase [Candidatus Shapirobacteria bacterium]